MDRPKRGRVPGLVGPGIAAADHHTALKITQVTIQTFRVGPKWAIIAALVGGCLEVVVSVVNHVWRSPLFKVSVSVLLLVNMTGSRDVPGSCRWAGWHFAHESV